MKRSGYFLSIGAGKNQVPLIEACVKLGLKVICVDQDENAPGFGLSTIRIISSITEYRKVHKSIATLALSEDILGIGSRSYGKATKTTAYLSERLNLPFTGSQSVAQYESKLSIKDIADKHGMLVPKPILAHRIKNSQGLPYPLIAKPADGSGKVGIQWVRDEVEFKAWQKSNRDRKKWILEEFIQGQELTVLGMVQNGEFHLISVTEKITTPEPPFLEIAHRWPLDLKLIWGEIRLQCQTLVRATGITNAPFVAEFKYTPEGKLYLLEAAPEVGGEYLADYLIPVSCEYDYFANLAKLLLGEPIQKPRFSNIYKQNAQAEIHFLIPPAHPVKFVGAEKFETNGGESLFLEQDLQAPGNKLDRIKGNACRIKVVGLHKKVPSDPRNWHESIQSRLVAHYE